jgi:ornithine cyclodeaminase
MLTITENELSDAKASWREMIDVMEEAVYCIHEHDYAQPIKPYLRYKDVNNRSIAMPAYIGGRFDIAGIKWIASFPGNIDRGLPRAHSVVILNQSDTGEPLSVINTPLLSIYRTAAVSGVILKRYAENRRSDSLRVSIIGMGPIGRHHLSLCEELLGNRVESYMLYDIRNIDTVHILPACRKKTCIASSWQEAYREADIIITCTVSKERYINEPPRPGALLLNVSLRDYQTDIFDVVKQSIIVDDWDEVCRENTDIEQFYKEMGLKQEQVYTLADVVCEKSLSSIAPNTPIMFNPMGMGVFDIALGKYYYQRLSGESQ